MNRRSIKRISIFTVVSLIVFFGINSWINNALVNNANAEACGNRSILGNRDVFWGNPPPLAYTTSPRPYPDVNITSGQIVRLSLEGELPGGLDCAGVAVAFNIYPDGQTNVIRTVPGVLRAGTTIIATQLGSLQWYVEWPNDLYNGRFRMRSVSIGGQSRNSALSTNVLIVTGGPTPPPTPTPVPPSCSISFTPGSVVQGQSTRAVWNSSNDADGVLECSCNGTGICNGSTVASGDVYVTPGDTQTCTLTAINTAGVANTCSASVTVTTPPPTVDLTANPVSIPYNGTSALSWTVSNATSCTASGGWTGSRSATGGGPEPTGNLTSTTTYTLSCTGPGGNMTDSVTISVGAQPSPPTASITCNGFASCVINSGSSATINWSSSNATACSVAPGGWTGTSGNQSTGNLAQSTTYTVSCTGAGGNTTASVTVVVITPQPTPTLDVEPLPSPTPDLGGGGGATSWTGSLEIVDPFSGRLLTMDNLFGILILFLYYIMGPIVVIMILVSGLIFLFSKGDTDKVNMAKRILIWAVVGLAIILIGSEFRTLLEDILSLGTSD